MTPLFLIGAGFNADAATEVGPIYGHSIYIGKHEIRCRYPLVADLPRICFEKESLEPDENVEQLLADAQETGRREPLGRLARQIMQADYYLAQKLTAEAASGNCYARFFDRFAAAHFLTFNYDSLVELFLLTWGRWRPDDGYGVPVLADRTDVAEGQSESTSLVLHLHGTFCLYISDHVFVDRTGDRIAWYEEVNPPRFIFDPHSISSLFYHYRRTPPTFGYEPVEMRVVAPVRDKSRGLQRDFIQRMYERATELISSAELVVSIGYSFNPADEPSYAPILEAVQSATLPRFLIIDPMANSISARLRPRLTKTDVLTRNLTFKQWVDEGCPLSGVD